MPKWKSFCQPYLARLTRTGARKSGRGWANTTKARVNLFRDHPGIRQLTDLHPLGASAASLGQSFTWLGNPFPIPLPIQRHTHLYHIHLMFICTLPLRISEKRMLCTSSAHVLPALWRYARTINVFQTTTVCGGSVRVPVSRLLHRLYAVPTQNLTGLGAFRSCLEISAVLKGYGNCRWQERTRCS